jgi:hypothetical protein
MNTRQKLAEIGADAVGKAIPRSPSIHYEFLMPLDAVLAPSPSMIVNYFAKSEKKICARGFKG